MSPEDRETEVTFVVLSTAPGRVFARLEALPSLGGMALQRLPEQTLYDRYFDLPDMRLRALGCSLRLRRAGIAWLLCLKGRARRRGLAVQRLEIEGDAAEVGLWERIAAAVGPGWPGALGTGSAGAVGDSDPAASLLGAGFNAIQERTTRRRRRELGAQAGDRIAELCIDSVAYRVEGKTLWHHEVELEAARGDGLKQLEPLSRALLEAFPMELRPWRPS